MAAYYRCRKASEMGERRGGSVAIDEPGYLRLASEVAAALFPIISYPYMKGSVVPMTNRRIASWARWRRIRCAVAMLDRLLHRSTVLTVEGESY
jgi:DNA replication protein DnaC